MPATTKEAETRKRELRRVEFSNDSRRAMVRADHQLQQEMVKLEFATKATLRDFRREVRLIKSFQAQINQLQPIRPSKQSLLMSRSCSARSDSAPSIVTNHRLAATATKRFTHA